MVSDSIQVGDIVVTQDRSWVSMVFGTAGVGIVTRVDCRGKDTHEIWWVNDPLPTRRSEDWHIFSDDGIRQGFRSGAWVHLSQEYLSDPSDG